MVPKLRGLRAPEDSDTWDLKTGGLTSTSECCWFLGSSEASVMGSLSTMLPLCLGLGPSSGHHPK
jgi:hypothetical protein